MTRGEYGRQRVVAGPVVRLGGLPGALSPQHLAAFHRRRYARAKRRAHIADGPDIDRDLDDAVLAGMKEVRYRNGLALAWIRVGLRTLTLALWLFLLPRSSPHEQALHRPIILVNVLHLAIGGWVLLALRRRRHVPAALALAASTDLLVVAFAGWSSEPGDGTSAAYLMGVMQLMLVLSGFTLPRYQTAAVGAIATAWELYLGVHLGLKGDLVAAMVLVTGIFAIAVTWASTRMMELAARRASGDYTGQLVRAHRDALAAANSQIAAQRDQVLAAQAEAETLAKLVVHDLKNPLAALQQFVWMARGRLSDVDAAPPPQELAEARQDLDYALEEVKRLGAMIGDLLLISRLESTALKPIRQVTPIRALLDDVANGMRLLGAERQVTVVVTAAPDLEASLDLTLTRRLLENLGSNALRFVNGGGKVELVAGAVDGRLVLGVSNTGSEIPAALRPHLFQKHSGGSEQTVHNLGLGLYLCRLVAEAHGGTMVLTHRAGWSASFEARLPL